MGAGNSGNEARNRAGSAFDELNREEAYQKGRENKGAGVPGAAAETKERGDALAARKMGRMDQLTREMESTKNVPPEFPKNIDWKDVLNKMPNKITGRDKTEETALHAAYLNLAKAIYSAIYKEVPNVITARMNVLPEYGITQKKSSENGDYVVTLELTDQAKAILLGQFVKYVKEERAKADKK